MYFSPSTFRLQLTFYSHMFGSNVRQLSVYARTYKDSNYGDRTLYSVIGDQDDVWAIGEVTVSGIPNGTPFQVRMVNL